MMKGVIYARFSSHAQREESIEGQLRVCHQYAKDHDITIIREYCDSAKSGRTDARQAFQQMLKDSDKKEFDCVLIYTRDRFARNRYDDAVNKHRLKKNGVTLVSVTQNISDDPESVLMESVLVGLAEYYSLDLARKVRRGMKENALKGKSNGGTTPTGYKIENGRYVIDEEYAPVIRSIFRWYVSGMTKKEITERLNEMGIKTKRGSEFNKNSLNTILKNRKYTGVYIHDGYEIEGGMPVIIDKDLFERAQHRKLPKSENAHYRAKVDYMLYGKIFCGENKHKMTGESARGNKGRMYYYYRCACKRIKKDEIERVVVDAAINALMNKDTVHQIAIKAAENMNRNDERVMLEQQLDDLEFQITNLLSALSYGRAESIVNRINELEAEKKKVELELLRQPKEITVGDIEMYLDYVITNRDEGYAKRIIDVLVNRVIVFDDHIIIVLNVSENDGRFKELSIDEIISITTAHGSPLYSYSNLLFLYAMMKAILL